LIFAYRLAMHVSFSLYFAGFKYSANYYCQAPFSPLDTMPLPSALSADHRRCTATKLFDFRLAKPLSAYYCHQASFLLL